MITKEYANTLRDVRSEIPPFSLPSIPMAGRVNCKLTDWFFQPADLLLTQSGIWFSLHDRDMAAKPAAPGLGTQKNIKTTSKYDGGMNIS